MKKLVAFVAIAFLMSVALPFAAFATDKAPAPPQTKAPVVRHHQPLCDKVVSNVGGGIVRTLLCAPKAVARVAVDTIGTLKTVKLNKPISVPLAPLRLAAKVANDGRQEAFDAGESALRVLTVKEPIPLDETGSVNAKVTELGLDPLVDSVFAAVISGNIVHNTMETGPGSHHLLPLKVGAWVGAGVAGSNLAVDALEK